MSLIIKRCDRINNIIVKVGYKFIRIQQIKDSEMYQKKDASRNYYSYQKITQSKYIKPQVYESPRDKSHLSSFQNFIKKKKSKSDLYSSLNTNQFKPKMNLNIASLRQKSVNLRTEIDEKDQSVGKKLQNYKIKKLQQKIRQSANTQRTKYQFMQLPSSRNIASVSQSKKNLSLSARKPSETKVQISTEKKIENQQRTMNLEIDTQKLNQFFQNKKYPSNMPQTTKSIMQYSQYNKAIKKNQMALRPFEQGKVMFKKNKEPSTQHEIKQQRNDCKFQPYYLKKDNYTPKASKKIENQISTSFERKTIKKQKQQPLSIKDFLIYKQLGKGQNGKIYSAFHKKTGVIVALKHFQQHKIIIDYLIDQIKIQLFINHPNILAAYGYIIEKSMTIDTQGGGFLQETKNKTFYNIYIIMEKGESNLFSLIRRERQLSEEDAAVFAEQILKGLKYLHHHKIIHRDLKPQNIIIVDGVCKITDFGWSVIGSEERETFCGTLQYVSPQVAVGSRYDNKIDIWSVGVLIFQMLTGEAPYDTTKILKNPKDQYRKRILSRLSPNVSFECKQLLSKLLKIDPKSRISIDEALNHKWIKEATMRKTLNKNVMMVREEFTKILKS